MDETDILMVYGARYARVEEALDDLLTLKSLHQDGRVTRYDAAVVTREESGKIIVVNTDATERGSGAAFGAIAGGIIGAVFPPAMIASAAVGAAAGGVGGEVAKRLSRRDVKDIAELLEPGQSGLLIVTERIDERDAERLFAKALRHQAIPVQADEDLKKAVFAEATLNA